MAVFVFGLLLAGIVIAVEECCGSCTIYREERED